MPAATAILGFGCAGYHAARALREAGCLRPIHVFTDSTLPPVNPMLTTYYAGGRLPYEGMFPFGASWEELRRELDLTVHAGLPVARLHARARAVETADGARVSFEQILIATGARPVLPPLGDVPADRVFCLRTAEDAVRLRERLDGKSVRRALVVGASMAGIKAVEALRDAGARCLLADLAPRIFPLAALPPVAEEIRRRIEAQGVELALGAPLDRLEARGDGLTARLGAREAEADLAVFCIGARPSLDFLDPGEIAVDRGVAVDETMESSAPGIYAAGDCCAGTDLLTGDKRVLGLWAGAAAQGRAAGCAMAGRPVPWEGSFPHNITHFLGMDFVGLGDVGAEGEILDCRRPGFWLRAVLRDGEPVCMNLLGNCLAAGPLKAWLHRRLLGVREPMGPAQRGMLLQLGLPGELLDRLEGRV